MTDRARTGRGAAPLNQVVVASATVGIVGFWIWFHIIENAFIIPFMPVE